MSKSAAITPVGFIVQAAHSSEGNAVRFRFGLPDAPGGFVLMLDAETAGLMAQDINTAVAVIERAERGRDDA